MIKRFLFVFVRNNFFFEFVDSIFVRFFISSLLFCFHFHVLNVLCFRNMLNDEIKLENHLKFFCVFYVLFSDSSSTFHHQRPRDGYNTFTDTSTILPTSNNAIVSVNKWTEPYFDTNISNNVTALVGKSAYLSCRVRNKISNTTVS